MVQDISLAVKVDKRQVKELGKLISGVEKQVGDLNKVKVTLDTTKAVQNIERLAESIRNAEKVSNRFFGANEIRKGIGAFSNSIGKARAELADVRSLFDQTTNGAERTRQAVQLLVGQFKNLSSEGRAFAKGGANIFETKGFTDLNARLKPLRDLPRSLAGVGEELKEIQFLLDFAVAGSKEFKTLIHAQNRALETQRLIREQIKRASGPMPGDPFGTKVPLLPGAGQTSGTFTIQERNTKATQQGVEAATEKLRIEKFISKENINQARITRAAAKERLNNIRKIRRKRQGKQLNDQLLGAGFPLLFGGGVGSVGGSILGGALGAPFGATFGGQIFGSAIGQQLEQSINKALELGEITKNINLDGLREAGILVNAEFQIAVEKLERLGNLSEAQNMVSEKVRQTTGLSGKSLEGMKAIFDALGRVAMQFAQTFGALAGTLLIPVVIALTKALEVLLIPLKLINKLFEMIAGAVRDLGKALGVTKTASELFGGLNARLAESRVKVEELGRAIRKGLIQSTEDLNLENQITLGLTSSDRLTNIDVGLKQQETQIKRKFAPRFAELFKLGNEGALVLPELTSLTQIQKNEKSSAQINANRKTEKETLEQTLRLTKNSLAVDKARLDLTRQTAKQFLKILSLSASEKELLEIKEAQSGVAFELDKKKLKLKLQEQLADARNADIREQLIAINNIEVDQVTRKFEFEQKLTKESERQLEIALKNQALVNKDALALQKSQGRVRLKEQEIAVDPAFMGPFGGSMSTAVISNLRIEQELLAKNAEIRAAERVAEESNKESDKERLNQLLRQRDAYLEIETAVLDATIFQERYNEVLALTTPVVDSLFDSLQAVAEGTKTAEQAFADFLTSIAKMLMQAAQQMIATYIAIGIAKMFAGMGGGGSAPAPDIQTGSGFGLGNQIMVGGMRTAASGKGALMNQPYVVGERGPELFVPRNNGTIVPNHQMGGGANVTVNVDASGSSVEGDGDQAAQLGKAIGIAVQQELIKQKRPGGLLTR